MNRKNIMDSVREADERDAIDVEAELVPVETAPLPERESPKGAIPWYEWVSMGCCRRPRGERTLTRPGRKAAELLKALEAQAERREAGNACKDAGDD